MVGSDDEQRLFVDTAEQYRRQGGERRDRDTAESKEQYTQILLPVLPEQRESNQSGKHYVRRLYGDNGSCRVIESVYSKADLSGYTGRKDERQMLKKNVEGLEKMAQDFLQYRWRIYLHCKKRRGEEIARPDFTHYCGATAMIEAMGGEWRRSYRGDDSEEQLNDPNNYHHWVILPSDEKCKRLNFNAWEE